jgi:hypothetical protein
MQACCGHLRGENGRRASPACQCTGEHRTGALTQDKSKRTYTRAGRRIEQTRAPTNVGNKQPTTALVRNHKCLCTSVDEDFLVHTLAGARVCSRGRLSLV